MARPGVTYTEVAEAAEYLIAEGKNPTIIGIQGRIGSGSTGTIGPHLKMWKKQLGDRRLAIEERLPQSLVTHMKGLWEAVCADSKAVFALERQEFEQKITGLQQEVGSQKEACDNLRRSLEKLMVKQAELKGDKESMAQTITQLEKEKGCLEAEKTGLQRELEGAETRVAELREMHRQVQANLEHYREAALVQRQQDETRHQEEKVRFEQSVKALQVTVTRLQHDNSVLEERSTALAEERNRQLEEGRAIRVSLDAVQISLGQAEEALARQVEKVSEQGSVLERLRKQLDEQSARARRAGEDGAAAMQKLKVTEEALSTATTQCQLLTQEKWQLEQERKGLWTRLEQDEKV